MSVILATQEAEIRRIVVQTQPRQILRETLPRKTFHKNRTGGVAQSEDPEFKLQYCKKEEAVRSFLKIQNLVHSHIQCIAQTH
jgi:hypothetical protein